MQNLKAYEHLAAYNDDSPQWRQTKKKINVAGINLDWMNTKRSRCHWNKIQDETTGAVRVKTNK
jgi:hypothetical protein